MGSLKLLFFFTFFWLPANLGYFALCSEKTKSKRRKPICESLHNNNIERITKWTIIQVIQGNSGNSVIKVKLFRWRSIIRAQIEEKK